MKNLAVKLEGISKRYRIGMKEEMHDTLGGAVTSWIKSPMKNFKRLRSLSKFNENGQDSDIIWAVRDISFEITEGEVLGIIGDNGAGKSTLLKILSRITDPTSGRIEMCGRVSSLLEVGTGFHEELTGRENVYLNGTILGMKKSEIDRKFEEIVDFSGIEKFIDTPIKRYSTGMKVRLAFSVAAHLEPEILIVDEVLAVGDVEFQKKCLTKMESVGKQGRTVIFVSHNMPTITRLCKRVILLDNGLVVDDGTPDEVVNSYLQVGFGKEAVRDWTISSERPGGEVAELYAVRVRKENGDMVEEFDIRESIYIEMEYEVLQSGYMLRPEFYIAKDGMDLFITLENDEEWKGRERPKGRYTSTVCIPGNLLTEGMIYVKVAIVSYYPENVEFWVRDAAAFNIIDNFTGDGARGDFRGKMSGVIRPLLKWKTNLISAKESV